ncbi:MAG: single-stranded DNA-binding protein [Actinobacteria bacterium]|nr:single-stranded DNA-binding protein [Actinomycetota bacterium]MCA1720185.1 single-stranded DNA-binding protein [Actinomycetota bacterium]
MTQDDQPRNEVILVGRVSGAAQERELPSGDVLLSWRLVVDRPPPRKPPPDGVRVPTQDTVDCVAFAPAPRRSAGALDPGDVVRVEGALRRRFWRAGAAAASRTEVEVTSVKRLTRAQASR